VATCPSKLTCYSLCSPHHAMVLSHSFSSRCQKLLYLKQTHSSNASFQSKHRYRSKWFLERSKLVWMPHPQTQTKHIYLLLSHNICIYHLLLFLNHRLCEKYTFKMILDQGTYYYNTHWKLYKSSRRIPYNKLASGLN